MLNEKAMLHIVSNQMHKEEGNLWYSFVEEM